MAKELDSGSESLRPGRELDTLIAERVMGWRRLSYEQAFPASDFQRGRTELTRYWHDVSGAERALAEDSHDYYQPEEAWSPSTDIAAAWLVVEKLQLSVLNLGSDGWYVAKSGRVGISTAGITAKSAAHAICLAALKVVAST